MNVQTLLKLNIDSTIALIFALSPFLQLYNLPVFSTNLEFTLVFIFGGMYATYVFFKRPKNQEKTLIKPIMIFMFIYCNINLLLFHGHIYKPSVTNFKGIFVYFLVLLICVFVFKRKQARLKYFEYVVQISIIMTAVVALQLLVYYTTGSTITTDRTFLLPFKEFFAKGVLHTQETGEWVFGSLFRPSGFFLEPAHFSQYCSIGLTYTLWKNKRLLNWQSVVISIGMIMTTSGLGLFCIILMGGVALFFYGDSAVRKKIARIASALLLFTIVFCGLFVFSDSFQRSVLRIVIASDGYNSAIMGRLWSVVFLEKLSSSELIYGMGFKNIPTYGMDEIQYYMTGIVELFYCQGIIGGSIFLILYSLMILKSYRQKEFLPLYILIAYLPYLVGSANLSFLTLIEYIPFLYVMSKNS